MKKIFLCLILFLAFNIKADECKNRGDLDILFCDENQDLVADPPKDIKKFKNPKTLVFTFTPVENPAIYEDVFQPFLKHLSTCSDKKVIFYQVQSNSAEIEAMRSGRLHIGAFATGPTMFAVNIAGAVPFALSGFNDGRFKTYDLLVVVKKDSQFQKLSDLKGKKVAHTSPSSNTGHMAPLALFPNEGLTPGKDYEIIFSGKHDQSLMGVNNGDYDAATVTSDVFGRMINRGQIKEDNFRIIYQKKDFPTAAYTLVHNLEPNLSEKIKQCFFNFQFTKEMSQMLEGAEKFLPASYDKEWKLVREIAEKSGEKFNKQTYDKQNQKPLI